MMWLGMHSSWRRPFSGVKFAFLNRHPVTCFLPRHCARRLEHFQNKCARVLVPHRVSKRVEADLKALSVTSCFPIQAPLLLSFPETS